MAQSVNFRKAAVGLKILAGDTRSQRKRLLEANYAPSTARKPKDRGLGEDSCVREALKLDQTGDPGKILQLARDRLQEKLETLKVGDERSPEIARTMDICEKWFGDREKAPREGRTAAGGTRIGTVQIVLLEAAQRGLVELDPRFSGPVIEAQPVAHRSVSHDEPDSGGSDDVADF